MVIAFLGYGDEVLLYREYLNQSQKYSWLSRVVHLQEYGGINF